MRVNPKDFQLMLASVGNLSAAQLTDLDSRIKATRSLMGGSIGNTASTDVEPGTDWLLAGILLELKGRGLGRAIPPTHILTKQPSYKHYQREAPRLREWLENAVPGMSRRDKQHLGAIVAGTLAKHIESWETGSISHISLLNCIEHLPTALDDAFPGYLAAGLLGALLPTRRPDEDQNVQRSARR